MIDPIDLNDRRETRANVTMLHDTLTAVDPDTGEIAPPTPDELIASLLDIRAERNRLYQIQKQIEDALRFSAPDGARKFETAGHRIEWVESKVYRYEQNPDTLRAVWDCDDIPAREKEKALQIGKKSLTSLRALSSWSAAARELVTRACEVVDTRSTIKISQLS